MPNPKAVLFDPNRRAASSIRERVRVRREVFDTLLPEMKSRAITAAKIDDMNALARIQEALARVPEGGNWNTARKQIAEELSKQWSTPDSATPAAAAKARAETILKNNINQAYAASRWAEQQSFKKDFPYLMYSTQGDSRTRPSHAALDGKILPVDDPFWQDHYPPWEFGCRCIAIGMTADEAEAKGVMTDKEKENYINKHGTPDPNTWHHNPGSLNIDLSDIVKGKTPEQAAYFAGTAIDDQVTMPDGTEQSVWRWTLNIKPGLDGATAAARKHVADNLSLDGLSDTPEHVEALNKATEVFSAARIALKQSKLPEMKATDNPDILSSITSSQDGSTLSISFNPMAFGNLDAVFKANVTDRLEAGIVRHNAIPDAAETAKSIAYHEFGHIILNKSKLADKEIRLLHVYQRAIDSGDINSISEYAYHSPTGREFFAEVFTMWKNGEYLPDYIVKLIKEVLG
jgi:SPP1 gp7 family putative phage head morphogenesis protein